MALHFSREEFAARLARCRAAMRRERLDGLLLFSQESMYWLTGYDSFGFCFFQCLVLLADGRLALMTRAPDLRQARHTSLIEDVRIWVDRDGATPADDLHDLLAELGGRGGRFGVEYDSHGLNARNGMRLNAALAGFCLLEDASSLVPTLRMVKSEAELRQVRRAAELADAALDEAHRLARPGADEAAILAAMQGAVLAGGGDYPGNGFIIGSGPDALLCRCFSGRRLLDATDQLTLEFAGVWRHYHACLMRTIPVGRVSPQQRAMHAACADALAACKDALRPGRPVGTVFDAHARVLDAAGFRDARLNACGYSLGAAFAPSWMDPPMLYAGNPVPAEPGMVFFLHMILMDSGSGLAMTLGETVVVTATGNESLSRAGLDLVAG